jgi:hypothetical protein
VREPVTPPLAVRIQGLDLLRGLAIGLVMLRHALPDIFAGAGVVGGQVIGRSDKLGAYAVSKTFGPPDLAATVYKALGVDPATEVRDRLGRPLQVCTGDVIEPLYSAVEV